MNVIEARELKKSYHADGVGVDALRGVDLVIGPGEIVALLGPSGSGKSTLLHILGLMDTASSGTLLYEGRDISSLGKSQMADIRRRQLGFIFQTFNLLPTFSAQENVELPMRLVGVSSVDRQARARELLTEVGLGDRLRHYPKQLSGGERQRVAIARALANNPKLVLADEPTGNLDSEATHSVMGILARANTRGRTLVIVTHNPEVASYCNRVLRMRDGRLFEDEKST
ncbi:ABC transporter ATP-binding protein [Chloroflexota bacterium]